MVHSLFTATDKWDDQLEGFEGGWPKFFQLLHLYLEHFKGQQASAVQVSRMVTEAPDIAWRALASAFNLENLHAGDRVTLPPELSSGDAVVERIDEDRIQRSIIARSDAPGALFLFGVYGIGEGSRTYVATYHYGEEADIRTAMDEPRWQARFGTLPLSSA